MSRPVALHRGSVPSADNHIQILAHLVKLFGGEHETTFSSFNVGLNHFLADLCPSSGSLVPKLYKHIRLMGVMDILKF